MITRFEILAIYEALTPAEVAILMGLGSTLPHNARHREERLREALNLESRERCGGSGTDKLPPPRLAPAEATAAA